MHLSIHSLLTFSLLLISSTLAAPIPQDPSPKVKWSTPPSCLRDAAEYDFRRCAADLNEVIRLAHESIRGIQIVGRRLVDVLGPVATVLPERLPVTHTCYPTSSLRQQYSSDDAPQWNWTDEEFVPFRLNIQCDDEDVITAYTWH